MREIKFRTWVKEEQKMIYGKLALAVKRFTSDYAYLNNEVEVMQYTGLKDKNDVEIYEGDILKVWEDSEYTPNRCSSGGIIDYDCAEGFSQIGVIGFTSCSFDYKTIKTLKGRHEEIHTPIDWINNYEVIGNIHENPELLENNIKRGVL